MRRQILRGFSMLMLIVAVAFVTAVASANGQTIQGVKANVPFEFTVGDKMLPAGTYTVRAITASGETLVIRSMEKGAVRLSNKIEARKAPETGKLVFHRYGEQYFLSEVWAGGDRTGRQLLKSRQERAIESQLAANPSKNDRASSAYEVVEIVAMIH